MNLALTAIPEIPEFPFNASGEFLVCAKLTAPQYQATNRAPMDLVCSIDRSGSMAGEKLNLVKETLEHVVQALKDCDRLALVTYDNRVETNFNLTFMTPAEKERALSIIRSIQPGGNTNLSGGLLQAINILKTAKNRQQVASVLLFTDGLANEGLTKQADIVRAMTDENFAASARGTGSFRARGPSEMFAAMSISSASTSTSSHVPLPCTVNTFGFGRDHDPNLLTAIAQNAGGVYYFVEKTEVIVEAFADCLGGLLSVVASDITIDFTAETGTNIVQVMTKWPVITRNPQKEAKLELRDMQSEENRHFLLKLLLPQLQQPTPSQPILTIQVSYTNAVTKQKTKQEVKCVVARPQNLSPNLSRDLSIDIQNNRHISATAMEQAADIADQGNLAQAQKIIQEAIRLISQSTSANDPTTKSFIKELHDSLGSLSSRQEYTSVGQKKMKSSAWAHHSERSSDYRAESQQQYQTSSRSVVHQAFHK